MEILLVIFSATVGAVIGSFLNVVISRGLKGKTLGGRSRCESCRKILSPLELIPILSFVIQKGRCRSCAVRLFWQEPLVESATAISYGLAAWLLYPVGSLTLYDIFLITSAYAAIAATIVIVVSDLKYYLIPTKAVIVLLVVGVFLSLGRGIYISRMTPIYDVGLALTIASVPSLLWLISQGRWMGLGDAKLFLAFSLITGFPNALAAFLFSFWAGGLWGIMLISAGKTSLKARLPFAPFIVLGTIGSIFWGQKFLMLTGISVLLDFMI